MLVHAWTVVALAICVKTFLVAAPASAQVAAPLASRDQQPTATGAAVTRRLTLDEAVQLALEQNVDLQVERLDPLIQDEQVAMARAAFAPTFLSDVDYDNTTTPPDSFLSGNLNTLKSDFLQGFAGVQHLLPLAGASYAFGWDASRSRSNSIFTNFDPRLRSNLRFSFTQPLLRNLATDSRRTQLAFSKRNREISDIEVRAVVVQTSDCAERQDRVLEPEGRHCESGGPGRVAGARAPDARRQSCAGRCRRDGAHRHRRG
jgi:hypothetical protein